LIPFFFPYPFLSTFLRHLSVSPVVLHLGAFTLELMLLFPRLVALFRHGVPFLPLFFFSCCVLSDTQLLVCPGPPPTSPSYFLSKLEPGGLLLFFLSVFRSRTPPFFFEGPVFLLPALFLTTPPSLVPYRVHPCPLLVLFFRGLFFFPFSPFFPRSLTLNVALPSHPPSLVMDPPFGAVPPRDRGHPPRSFSLFDPDCILPS